MAGRGGRGQRLMESLKQIQKEKVVGVSQHEPKSEQPSSVASTHAPTLGRGGRGRLLQTLASTVPPVAPTSESPPRESSSSSSGQPSPSGAVGGSPPREDLAQLRISYAERRQLPSGPDPIMNKARGTEGDTIDVAVNYVRIKTSQDTGIFEYHVTFTPNIDSRSLRYKILKQDSIVARIGNVMQFTGMNLYLPHQFDDISITTEMPNCDTQVRVDIQFIKTPPFHELVPFYNTLFRRIMNELKLVQIQRHYFDPMSRIEVPAHKLEIWPGWVSSIQDFDGGLMLNCEASHRILRTNTAREVLQDIFQLPDGRSKFKEYALKRLVGCVVLTRYNNMPYRVDDISFDQNPMSTFEWRGSDITYIEYFKKSWQIDIKDHKQPLIIHRPKPRKGETVKLNFCSHLQESRMICLIPELCYMTGLTDDMRCDTRAMKDISSHTRIKPGVRQAKLTQFIRNVNTNPAAKQILDNWGLELEETPLVTQARTMVPDKIIFGNNLTAHVGPKADWTRDATNKTLFHCIDVDRWVLIITRKDTSRADDFIKCLKQVTRNMGFNFADPRLHEAKDDSAMAYTNAIRESVKSGDQIVVLMTPGNSQREDRYNAIKRLTFCELHIPSQVVRAYTLSDQKMRSVCQKIAIQISCKIGGQPWAIPIPFKSCMIVGIDVYHDGGQRGKSVVAVVSSINPAVTRWYSRVYFQKTQEEIVNTLESGIVSSLKKYYEVNHFLPQRIFIYRDGVGDGQLSVVKDYEIVQVENAILDFGKSFQNYKPTVSLVVVQKRINTKILMKGREDFENPPPGSVLDHSVTRKNYYDFFLISQFVNQGTVTPTHYIVLYDNNNMTPDRMQKLAYKMSHLYYNWPGTIRVPAPCQYAHKAAHMVGLNIKKAPAEELCDKLYYL